MKKIFLGIFLCLIFLTGCGKKSEGDVLKSYTSAVEKAKSYYLNGKMELVNNEDVYTYDISVSYEADDNYKIELVNTVNNHEQVILRNSEGVYVVTPSLNKSFKFQSDWPYNNSQVYLLSSLLDDINNDEERVFETKDNEYVFTTRVNYPNSPKLEKQKIYFNANNLPTRVEVLDKDGNVEIKMVFNKIDLKADFNDTYFDLSSILDTEVKEENNEENKAISDLLTLKDEIVDENTQIVDPLKPWKKIDLRQFKIKKMHIKIFEKGKLIYEIPSILDTRNYVRYQIDNELWDEEKRFVLPHTHYLDFSKALYDLKIKLIEENKYE